MINLTRTTTASTTMYVTVSQPNHGPAFNIKPGENLNPVKTLRLRYEAWLKAHPEFKR